MMSSDDCFILAKIHCLHRKKNKEKDRRKTLPEFPKHTGLNLVCNFAFYDQNLTDIRQEFGLRCPLIFLSNSRDDFIP
jgi:hypothetical protein